MQYEEKRQEQIWRQRPGMPTDQGNHYRASATDAPDDGVIQACVSENGADRFARTAGSN
jgi:hypothetical protein